MCSNFVDTPTRSTPLRPCRSGHTTAIHTTTLHTTALHTTTLHNTALHPSHHRPSHHRLSHHRPSTPPPFTLPSPPPPFHHADHHRSIDQSHQTTGRIYTVCPSILNYIYPGPLLCVSIPGQASNSIHFASIKLFIHKLAYILSNFRSD